MIRGIKGDYVSPHFGERLLCIEYIILHYTDTADLSETMSIFTSVDGGVSSHYVIDIDGSIYSLVSESKRAWHAGVSYWRGETDMNSCSIGIELQNGGHSCGYVDFPDLQIESLLLLLGDIYERYDLGVGSLLGHSDIAPGRKIDPGVKFPWLHLSERGFGIFPDSAVVGDVGVGVDGDGDDVGVDDLASILRSIGYDVGVDDLASILRSIGYGGVGVSDRDCIESFQRRYRAGCVDGVGDFECLCLGRNLLRLLGCCGR